MRTVTCPNCGKQLLAQENIAQQTEMCTECRTVFDLPPLSTVSAPLDLSVAAAASVAMPFDAVSPGGVHMPSDAASPIGVTMPFDAASPIGVTMPFDAASPIGVTMPFDAAAPISVHMPSDASVPGGRPQTAAGGSISWESPFLAHSTVEQAASAQAPPEAVSHPGTPDPSAGAAASAESKVFVPPPGDVVSSSVPRYYVPAAIMHDQASAALSRWLARGFWQPSDFNTVARGNRLTLLHVPTWIFSAEVRSDWEGQYSETRTRTVARTRTTFGPSGRPKHEPYTSDESYKEWFVKQGTRTASYADYCDAAGLPGATGKQLLASFRRHERPQARRLTQVDRQFVAMRAAVDRDDAARISRKRIARWEEAACRRLIERLTRCQTSFARWESSLVYLPVWDLSCEYRGSHYRVLINALTGEVIGSKPVSAWKVTAAVVIALLAALALLSTVF